MHEARPCKWQSSATRRWEVKFDHRVDQNLVDFTTKACSEIERGRYLETKDGGMTTFVKTLVSKKKRRFVENGFDLDLTCILATTSEMSFGGGYRVCCKSQ